MMMVVMMMIIRNVFEHQMYYCICDQINAALVNIRIRDFFHYKNVTVRLTAKVLIYKHPYSKYPNT